MSGNDPQRPDGHTPDVRSDRYDLRVLQALRKIIRSVDIYSRRLKAEYQITGPQLICLLAVAEESPTTATRIAEKIHVSASTVVGILDRLEERGYLQRERDSTDRRVVNISITPAGKALADRAPSPLQAGLAEALGRLDDAEQATIARSLERVVELMQVPEIDASPILETGQFDQAEDIDPRG